jgi:hypothetical protein
MRLIEAITIYLAAGASFGVYDFLRERNLRRRVPALLKPARAAILWPLVAAKFLFLRASEGGTHLRINEQTSAHSSTKIWRAQDKLLASLYRFAELAQVSFGRESSKTERASHAVREVVEKYVGLTLAAQEIDMDAAPTKREMEIARVAGRTGDDLRLAGRCVHRRNASRLGAHRARARTELLHTLAEIREITSGAAALANVVAARNLSVATVRFYGHAFNLLSLLKDEAAAASVARLLDAECGRLRRLEALSLKETRVTEEELCTTHARRSALTGL